jgi:hypothetical protein
MSIVLYDWIVTEDCVRGSREGDSGFWLSTSPKPKSFDPDNRILTLVNGTKYILYRENVCKVGKIPSNSERILSSLPN